VTSKTGKGQKIWPFDLNYRVVDVGETLHLKVVFASEEKLYHFAGVPIDVCFGATLDAYDRLTSEAAEHAPALKWEELCDFQLVLAVEQDYKTDEGW
jgi:hypothetical protein